MISVCMATFNGERYLMQQLESILDQLPQESEVIVSDDGSNDGTISLLEKIASSDRRLRIINGPGLSSIAKNFENALVEAKGDMIFLADQDDIWLPKKVAECIKGLYTADMVLSNCRLVDEQGRVMNCECADFIRFRTGLIPNLVRNRFTGSMMAFRSSLLKHILPIPDRVPMHDWWIGMNGCIFGRIKYISTPLVLYRRHNANASSTGQRSKRKLGTRISNRISMTWYIFLRWIASIRK